ncbi:MAG: glycosyltransferase family 4 protein [Methylacidiphilales bacterium]|nr:glycosyltransferase family 4 protein [Candidatus Methylacidiphilales bacterium]
MNRAACRPWIVAQIGAREHYGVARALATHGCLAALVTDLWASPRSAWGYIPHRHIRERYHADLKGIPVLVNNCASLAWEFQARARGWRGSELFMERNEWFQKQALRLLSDFVKKNSIEKGILFAYSYAARNLLKWAKENGWKTILGQIDPGSEEEKIIAEKVRQYSELAPKWRPIKNLYWDLWREECSVADVILVNSAWSKELVMRAGIDSIKLKIVPLAYERAVENHKKSYPLKFDIERPLRVLFLGQVSIRKGIVELLEAAEFLKERPIEFWIVGPIQIDLSVAKKKWSLEKVKFFGAVARGEVDRFYSEADVFVFPTHSDGFGITQLEAINRGLPVIASRFCGEVVKDNVNGKILDEVSSVRIIEVLDEILLNPRSLEIWSRNTYVEKNFLPHTVAERILSLV